MQNIGLFSRQIQGLLFGVDNRQPTQPFILDGRNFIFDVKGPYSFFGSTYLTADRPDNAEHVHFFQIRNETFITIHDSFYRFNPTTLMLEFLFKASQGGNQHYPWFKAYVGGKYYFSNRFAGLIEYNPSTGTFIEVSNVNLPSTIHSICDSGGRLVVLGDTKIHWSAQDVALDLTPDLATGAGTQSHSLIGGDPLVVLPYVRGFLTFTTEGILKSELSGTVAVFRHTGLSKEHVLLSSFAAISTEAKGIIFLTTNGLYSTSGDIPEVWEPLFSAYLHSTIIPAADLSIPEIFRFYYTPGSQQFYFSVGENNHSGKYYKSYVLELNVGKWGSLDKSIYGIGELQITSGEHRGKQLVYFDSEKYLKIIKASSFNTELVDFSAAYFWPGVIDQPVRHIGNPTTHIFPSTIICKAWRISHLANKEAELGYYTIGDANRAIDAAFFDPLDLTAEVGSFIFTTTSQLDLTPKKMKYPATGLDSFVEIGLYGFTDGTLSPQLSTVTDLTIGTDVLNIAETSEDWNILSGEEDWNTLSGEEDWGFGVSSGNSYVAELKSSVDGLTINELEYKKLTPFIRSPSQNNYETWNTGYFHSAIIRAEEINATYHIAVLGYTGSTGGQV